MCIRPHFRWVISTDSPEDAGDSAVRYGQRSFRASARAGHSARLGDEVENEKRSTNEEQLLAHSLPGTNQAGKGADNDERARPDEQKRNDDQEHLDAHSLPGTNQAGKGARVENK